MSTPTILQDEFSIRHGSAVFRLIWSDLLTADDKADLIDWLKLVERRIQRMPEVGPLAPVATGAQHEQ
jgi:hypothetical protein